MENRRAFYTSRTISRSALPTGFLRFFVIAPEDEPEDDRQRQQGPADGSRDPTYASAEQVTAGLDVAEER
jgi:hypothetical protein